MKTIVLLILIAENFLHECLTARMNGLEVPKSVKAGDHDLTEEEAQAVVDFRNVLAVSKKPEFDAQSVADQILFAQLAKAFFAGQVEEAKEKALEDIREDQEAETEKIIAEARETASKILNEATSEAAEKAASIEAQAREEARKIIEAVTASVEKKAE